MDFVNIILWLSYIALVVAVGAIAFSLWRTTRTRSFSWHDNRISVIVGAITVGALAAGYAIGRSLPDMFIIAIAILIVAALIAICLSIARTKYLR